MSSPEVVMRGITCLFGLAMFVAGLIGSVKDSFWKW